MIGALCGPGSRSLWQAITLVSTTIQMNSERCKGSGAKSADLVGVWVHNFKAKRNYVGVFKPKRKEKRFKSEAISKRSDSKAKRRAKRFESEAQSEAIAQQSR